jgi:hypothetical protein
MTRRLCVWVFALGWCAVVNLSCGSLAWSEEFAPGRQVGIIETDLIREASGIVASRRNAGVLWVHNDSGDGPRLYALDTQGKLLGVCVVTGARARDWEDIAVGPGPEAKRHYLYIGDIGDNSGRYASVRVYRVPEPEVNRAKAFGRMYSERAETIELTYPDKPRDAETLLVDPQTGDLYVISKRELFNKVYWVPYPQSTTSPTVMKQVATLPWGFAVAGDVSPDGGRVVVRSPYNASVWTRPKGAPLWRAFEGKAVGVPLMAEPQGEGISFDGQGRGYFTVSEMANPPLHYFAPAGGEDKPDLSDGSPK